MDIEYLTYNEIDELSISVNEYFFLLACKNGYKEWLDWAQSFDPSLTINMKDNLPFQLACENGNLEIVKYFGNKYKYLDFRDVDFLYSSLISCNYDMAIYIHERFPQLYDRMIPIDLLEIFSLWSVKNKSMAMWLYDAVKDIPINLFNHEIFVSICNNNDIILAEFLVKRRPNNYYIQVVDNFIVHYEITHALNIIKTIEKSKINTDICCICFDNDSNIYTSCNHMFCDICLTKHYNRNGNKCPCCRRENFETDLYRIV